MISSSLCVMFSLFCHDDISQNLKKTTLIPEIAVEQNIYTPEENWDIPLHTPFISPINQISKIEGELEFVEPPFWVTHVETPDVVKSLYYTAYSTQNKGKREKLTDFIENTEINSVTIDIKTVSGYVSFDMSEYEFEGDITPVSDYTIKNIKKHIVDLHEQGVYVIGRIVVFKDKLLAETRPDLAVKWDDGVTVWEDYKGKKYLDPSSREVWQYNADLARIAYEIGFDEINFDYIRFPSDGKISKTYYPFSHEIQQTSPTWGNIMAIDAFGAWITEYLREKHPDITLSADIFGLVMTSNGYRIGQNLESFLLNFDYIGPMIYPSHYGKGYLGYDVPDNYPYEIFVDAYAKAERKIIALNQAIESSQREGVPLQIQNAFTPQREISDITTPISSQKIRPWIQGFTCTWCPGATDYTRYKFRRQIQAIEESGGISWWVWSSSSSYYKDWYNKE